jgi:urease accessory protein
MEFGGSGSPEVRKSGSPAALSTDTGPTGGRVGTRPPDLRTSGPPDFLLLQLADSAFPVGGFAHSGGLEAAWQLGEVSGTTGLEAFLRESLEQCGQAALPFVAAGFAGDPPRATLDRECDVFLSNHVANRASRALGQGLVATVAAAFGASHPALAELKATIRRERAPAHLAPAFGAVCAALGVARGDCLRLFLFLHLRGLVSSAVRLGIAGPLEAQALQHRLGGDAEAVLARCGGLALDEAAGCAPLLELFHGHHDRLYSRLFSS